MTIDTQVQKDDDASKNFEALRKKYESAEREKQAAMQKVAEYEKVLAESKSKKAPEQEVDDESYDEPYVDHKRLKKQFNNFEQNTDKKIQETAERIAKGMIEKERNENFLKQNQDFSQVLSKENIDKFVATHPDIAEPMLDMPEGFSRQKLLYQQIKALGINKPPEQKKTGQQMIDENRKNTFYQPSGVAGAPYNAMAGDFSDNGQKAAYDKVQELKRRIRL